MQAYEFMLAGQLQRAHAPLEQAYKSRPLAQQPRPLILNRAILDIAQKVNVMRPVKDLRDYLANLLPGQVDEDAVDLLGAALQVAAKNPKWVELPLYKTAEKQMQNSIEVLEQARPHERKWGQKWYREIDFRRIQFDVNRATQAYKFEQDRADRLLVALDTARADAARYNTLNTSLGHRHVNASDAYYCNVCRNNRLQAENAENAHAKAIATEGDYKVQKLKAEKAKKEIPQPDWAAVPFRAFHPDGRALPPPVEIQATPGPLPPPSEVPPPEVTRPSELMPPRAPDFRPVEAPAPRRPAPKASEGLFDDLTPTTLPATREPQR
jgi:hypothetical protein